MNQSQVGHGACIVPICLVDLHLPIQIIATECLQYAYHPKMNELVHPGYKVQLARVNRILGDI